MTTQNSAPEVVIPIGAGGMAEAARAPLIPPAQPDQPLGLGSAAQKINVDKWRCIGVGLLVTLAYFTPPVLIGTLVGVNTSTSGGVIAAAASLMVESCCICVARR